VLSGFDAKSNVIERRAFRPFGGRLSGGKAIRRSAKNGHMTKIE
jgi:hypothetical protein